MPKVSHNVTVNAPVQDVWNFISDINNWAPFLLGYKSHKVINEDESEWMIKPKLAVIAHPFRMNVKVTERIECERINFQLEGISDATSGNGTGILKDSGNRTEVIFELELRGRGVSKSVVKHIVGPRLKPMAEKLLDQIAKAVEKIPASK